MFANYLKIALRNLRREKIYSFINIAGLAVGMACFILILLWVQDELSYDSFHNRADNLYRVTETWRDEGSVEKSVITSALLGPALKEENPEITLATRYSVDGEQLIKYKDKRFQNDVVALADNDFLNMFSFPLIAGNSETALRDKFSVVISEEMKRKYFANENPIGKVLNINRRDFTVTAVMQNIPRNSHIQFDCLVPFDSRRDWLKQITDRWTVSAYFTYVLLNENVRRDIVAPKINGVVEKHAGEHSTSLGLQALKDIHLYSGAYDYSEAQPGDIRYVYTFTAMALLILFIACINFVNLTTARSSTRAREIGVRKVVGAQGKNIRGQFFGESILMSFLAMFLSLVIVELTLPGVNSWLGRSLTLNFTANPLIVLSLAGLALFSGIVAGIYPAIYLSSFQPVKVLKGTFDAGSKSVVFRKILVVTQFTFSIFLIISAVVISNQLYFMTRGDLGFDREYLLYVRMRGGFLENYDNIKRELLQYPHVLSVSAGVQPTSLSWASQEVDWEGKDPERKFGLNRYNVDFGYIETLEMEIVQGRNFSTDFAADETRAYVLNEEAVKQMELVNPIGKRFSFENREGTIIGVVKNFHQKSLHNPIYPLVMQIDRSDLKYLLVRIKPEIIPEILRFLEERWMETANEYLFEYHFLDETIENFYGAERQMRTIFIWATVLAIFISCLGLFGLSSFATEKRTKEIGIRKVLGATAAGIVKLLSGEFIILVAIANIIAWPFVYVAMNSWLENFAYRTEIGWWIFAMAGGLALAIALFTVSFQAIKAAVANPVDALRYE
jgi:predicted permease